MILINNFSTTNAIANSSDIQEAINLASYSDDRTIVLPSGFILVNRLFFYYDPILNPGFNPNSKQGFINLIGQGTLDIAYARNKVYKTGTILKSIYTGTEECFSSGNSSHNSSPYKSRHPKFKAITLVGENPGYVIESNNPEANFEDVKIIQENELGSGLKVGACWFYNLEKTFIMNNSPNIVTGIGLSASTGTPGGLFGFEKSLVDGFNTGILYEGNNYFNNFNIIQSAIQNCSIAFRNTTRLISVNFDRVYFEGCDNEIISDAEIDNVIINSYFSTVRKETAVSNCIFNKGVRNLSARNISVKNSQADFIEIKKNTSSVENYINLWGLNYFYDNANIIIESIISITNSNGLCRVKINSHRYISGKKVILKDTPYDGEYFINVIDVDTIDLINSNFVSNFNGGKCAIICHGIRNIDNIPSSNIDVKAITCTDYGINFVRGVY